MCVCTYRCVREGEFLREREKGRPLRCETSSKRLPGGIENARARRESCRRRGEVEFCLPVEG